MAENKQKSAEELKKEFEEKQKGYISDLKNYAYGGVAGKALAQGNLERASTSLDKLVSEMFGKDARLDGLLAGVHSSEKAVETAATIYASKYQNALGGLTVSNLWGFYGENASKYLGDLKSKADEEIAKFKDVEFGKVMEKYFAAKEKVESKTKNFSKEDKEKAQKELQKYQNVMLTLNTLSESYMDKYEAGVTEQSRKDLLNSIYAKEGEGKK